ncbi:hypothetical protein G3I40_08180 [Streptomyces sp. SID14478]|uniref:hypothetical protein n=1 Tax=Streptomyces sp. SID14478 TaxID=2706073 RepID=UPI0013DD5175|nr:hypothetical protein [Streptomyces sp. SID14478]NEB75206.1 hypothetical protein [Streptomyces sp. SID14478]
MSASEREVRRTAPLAGRDVVRGVSMGDLLASCAAARAVSTPPAPARVPDERRPTAERRDAA